MVVLVLASVPPGLRGMTTRWLLEIAPGVFVGRLSQRMRTTLWRRVMRHVGEGSALLVWRSPGEQGLEFLRWNYPWESVDFDGLMLMARPTAPGKRTEVARRLSLDN